jgi:hypothetical protein
MRNTVYSRMFERLADLIPSAFTTGSAAVFYAPPRIKNDYSTICQVQKVEGGLFLVEMANDTLENGIETPAPWIKLRVDVQSRVAEVIEMQDPHGGYQVAYMDSNIVHPRRSAINLFAVNWLQIMIGLEVSFQAIDSTVSA